MSEERNRPDRHSASAEAAATRWRQTHPDEDVDLDAPSHVPEDDRAVPNRHSASAEAAMLRWRERNSSVWASPAAGDEQVGQDADQEAGQDRK
jgi:hypothetical protein